MSNLRKPSGVTLKPSAYGRGWYEVWLDGDWGGSYGRPLFCSRDMAAAKIRAMQLAAECGCQMISEVSENAQNARSI